MHESKRQINDVLAPLLKRRGYRKRRLTWHKGYQDTILVFHVEKNRWGANNYTFHLGIYLRGLGDELTPTFYRCPIQAFIDEMVQDKDEFRKVMDFENTAYELRKRLERFSEYVTEVGIPWLENHSTLASLILLSQSERSKLLPQVLMNRDAHYYLNQVVSINQ